MTSFTERNAQLQAVIDDESTPANTPVTTAGHPAASLLKEGMLEWYDHATKRIKATWNGTKYMKRLKSLGYLTGTVPTPLAAHEQVAATSVQQAPAGWPQP